MSVRSVRDLHVQCSLQVRNFKAQGMAMSDCCQQPATSAVEMPNGNRMWRCNEHQGLRTLLSAHRGPIHWSVEVKDPKYDGNL